MLQEKARFTLPIRIVPAASASVPAVRASVDVGAELIGEPSIVVR